MAIAGWPVAADYDEAIQNPHLNFDDPELKAGEPECDKFGSPLVRSGNFASVYLLIGTHRKAAVRCFLRDVPDQQDRYAAIGHDLLSLSLPYTVDFEFVPKGIKVQGSWFPILKMDWCDGELLDRYIEKNLDNPLKLRRLADKWFEMSVVLRKEGIAHGDLQHGNVFVLDDEIKLIDYDGMFVPRLAGRQSAERGLEHYQHPKREDSHFGRYLDNFANWVIYTTIYALSVDPSLWRFANLPDKHLLFQKKDYEDVANSPTFQTLKAHEDGTIRTYATTLENLLLFDVPRVPDFNPDKPVLYPPARPAVAVQTTHSDRGGLHDRSDRGPGPDQGEGDRGRLLSQEGGDRGGLADQEGDRGRLFDKDGSGSAVQVGDGQKKDEAKKPSAARQRYALIGGGSVVAVALGVWVWSGMSANNQKQAVIANLRDGIFAAKKSNWDNAKDNFEKVTANPNADSNSKTTAKCLSILSELRKLGKSAPKDAVISARAKIEAFLQDDPKNATGQYVLGQMYEHTDDRAEALKHYKLAMEADSADEDFKEAVKRLQK